MKLPSRIDLILGFGVAVLAATIGLLVVVEFEPDPIKFESLEVVNSPVLNTEMLYILAETERRQFDDCTNGVQIDVRDEAGAVTRYPVPAREIVSNLSRYAIVIPERTSAGKYQIRVRETTYCGGSPKIVDAPWLPFEIVEGGEE